MKSFSVVNFIGALVGALIVSLAINVKFQRENAGRLRACEVEFFGSDGNPLDRETVIDMLQKQENEIRQLRSAIAKTEGGMQALSSITLRLRDSVEEYRLQADERIKAAKTQALIADAGQSSANRTLQDVKYRLNAVEAATSPADYVHCSKLPEGFRSSEHGPQFPRIIIDGERLSWNEADKHYCYVEGGHPAGYSNRAMWMQAGKSFYLMTPDYTDPKTGKVLVRHRGGLWIEDHVLTVRRKQIAEQAANAPSPPQVNP